MLEILTAKLTAEHAERGGTRGRFDTQTSRSLKKIIHSETRWTAECITTNQKVGRSSRSGRTSFRTSFFVFSLTSALLFGCDVTLVNRKIPAVIPSLHRL